MKRPITFLLLILLFTGCGYSIRKTPVGSVNLGRIDNLTLEPKLEDRLAESLVLSLMKNGIRIDRRSDYTLSGAVNSFSLRGLSEKEGITVSYEVIVRGRFYLQNKEGQRRELSSRGLFIISFAGEGPLEGVLANKEEAVERALSDMADELAASIIYER